MAQKRIIPYIHTLNEVPTNVINLSVDYANGGADELILYDYGTDEKTEETILALAKEITKQIDIPFIIGMHIKRFEDVKKALYTGASYVMMKYSLIKDKSVILESTKRFGVNKIIIELDSTDLLTTDLVEEFTELGVYAILIKHVNLTSSLIERINSAKLPIIIRDSLTKNDITDILNTKNVVALATNYFENKDLMKVKNILRNQGIDMNTFESTMKFTDFKLNSDGLIPVITQDYKTSEVLMLAYMNEEAFRKTIETGKMTYYSRSRKQLWTKGETSGHLQYVKSLSIDCDNDTMLAKVLQKGAACHTGNRSCFYTELVKKEYDDINPLTVFSDVYNVIMDRKNNPKEGSYTNYLFDKGIDKILKKCGEEATEIVIAAKNPDAEELKYEISDFLYHMMVLMAECGLDWNDVIKELAHRR